MAYLFICCYVVYWSSADYLTV